MTMPETSQSAEFDQATFFDKLKAVLKKIGLETAEKALWLFYSAQSPNTPSWAKTTIYGALAYFVLPIDAIPDILPGVGFTDDAGVLLAAVTVVAVYIDDEVRQKASKKMKEWFGKG